MLRTMLLIGMAFLFTTTTAFSQTDEAGGDTSAHITDGLASYQYDADCPGCRAFLAGYGSADSMHSPSCSCNAAMGDGGAAGAAGVAGADGAGAGGGDYQELLASDFGAGLGYESAAPGMIGDFFGSTLQMNIVSAGQVPGEFTTIPQAGGDRRFKISENYSPFPVDRVFFNYNHFKNALLTADGRDANLDRGTFGAETTFFDRWWSLEFRLPVTSGLASDQFVIPNANNVSNELGNIAFALKRLLYQSDTLATSIGMGMVLPTGPDANLFDFSSLLTMTVENEAFYLQPFVGAWWTPNDRFFAQFAAQLDFDAHGNTVDFVRVGSGPEGVIQDQTLLFLDASFGYWLFHDPYGDGIVTGLAPMIEIHHNTTLTDADILVIGSDTLTNPSNRLDVMNLTGAIRLELAGTSYLTMFGVAPLRTDEEKLFDAEFGVQYTRFY